MTDDPLTALHYIDMHKGSRESIELYRDIIYKHPEYSCIFAIKYWKTGFVDLKKCEEVICSVSDKRDAIWAYMFAKNIPGVDIKKCCKAACLSPEYAYWFALEIADADLDMCQKAVYNSRYESIFYSDIHKSIGAIYT